MSLNSHFFYNITRKVIINFSDIFNDTNIARYDQFGNIIKFIKVPVKVAPKTKQWYWTELRENQDRRDSIFPMMSIDLTDIKYAQDRQVNRNMKIEAFSNGTSSEKFYNPIPYDFEFNVQIVSEYITDITQITEQILPSFSPESYIRISVPELNISGIQQNGQPGSDKLELRVGYDSSESDFTVELEEAGYRILLWNLKFIVHGYLFSPLTSSIDSDKPITRVISSYYLNEDTWSDRLTDSDNDYYNIGIAQLEGVSTAKVIPSPDQPVDDSYRTMVRYEHYPKVNKIVLYTNPSLSSFTSYPVTFSIQSSEPVREIWYTVVEIDDTYIQDSNFDFIINDNEFIILDSLSNELPTFQYFEPIMMGEGLTSYIVSYIGVGLDGSVTKLFTENISCLSLPLL